MLTKEELQKQLDEMKVGLEESASKKAKELLAIEIKRLESEIENLKKANPDFDAKAFTASLDEIKKSVSEIQAAQVKRDEADKENQKVIDDAASFMKNEGKKTKQKGEAKSFGDAIVDALNEGDNFKNIEMLSQNHKDRNKRFSIEVKGFDQKAVGDVTVANLTGGTRSLQVLQPGIIEQPARKVHVRQLVPVGTIGAGTSLVFMRENGDGEGSIAATLETDTKPQFDVDLQESTVNIETIAGWLRVTRKAMNNIPGFVSFLQTRLPEKLLRVEDTEMLEGSGTSPHLKGIMTAGNFTAATSTGGTIVEQIIDSIAQLEDDEDRSATGILLRPNDYYRFFKLKASTSGVYDLPKNVTFINGVLYISGVPVFASTAMSKDVNGASQHKYIVGDWTMGAQLLIQEGVRIEFFEQDSTNVRENKITVRIEETIAFPVYGDNFFIVGNASQASS